ncbi:DSD1 family PLP-dependent enzyme [Sulfitobacter sp. D35]|uniref:DSD1 family PLP-dependent enzyme n=1 Tax=Sulfitobacter sp. D35 TaxID=3083252 RepID=UPI00296F824F|nr:DSD1 family PLP-dependent enzyme [Sulfitobacter sp. D35]MDW4499668.1 DSD1 family PLP-dependent enzyme [Sulfitobacter sp. D35]
MPDHSEPDPLVLGYDVPALVGQSVSEVITPCLVLDLDALERNIRKLGAFIRTAGVRHRAHGKMHRSADVARLQQEIGGACGVCCQKVSEAEAFVRGGIRDILVTNEVRDRRMIARLADLPKLGARVTCCVDDAANVAELSEAATAAGTTIGCLVEIDVGQARCGVAAGPEAVALAQLIDGADGLTFEGVQAYQGAMQHIRDHAERAAAARRMIATTADCVETLTEAGLACNTVGGGGTGSFRLEALSGLYNELQCGSYAFMDADYGRVRDAKGDRLDATEFENALFLLTSVMSHAQPDRAVVDAGLKVMSLDSGLPEIFGRDDVVYESASDEHGTVSDPGGALAVGDRLWLVPGHCDPTCNLHDWYVGIRDGHVETLWPVTARGKSW